MALARAERAADPAEAARLAREALEAGVRSHDPDLELRALAQLGVAEVSLGAVDEGLARFDEAMAAATGGEPTTLETFADVCCSLLAACELAGDEERPRQWSEVVESFVRKYDHVPLLAFCRSCAADVHAARGRPADAEEQLVEALRELTTAGQRARCVHPAARLAELRVSQGRFDEADRLLDGVNRFARLPLPLDAARARLELARSLRGTSPQVAIDVARRARSELEAHGAAREADEAAALLRSLGARGRSGPREHGVLSRRETEVLRLLGEGLTNAAIARRLFISPKTAEHHVGRIYQKLDVRSRAEAAAYAVRHLDRDRDRGAE